MPVRRWDQLGDDMNIQGLQKMTLLDFPGRVACTVFLGGCNFRCPFCHNFGLAIGDFDTTMPEEDFFAFLDTRKGLLNGVAITGGEPCLRKDLAEFLEKVKQAGFDVKLDTNGSKPDMLEDLVMKHLVDYVAMDIKASRANYAKAVGTDLDLSAIENSVELLMSGTVPYEFRTTVVKGIHTEEDFEDIAQWISGAKQYFLQPFAAADIVPDKSLDTPSAEQLEKYLSVVSPFVGFVGIRGLD